MALSNKGRKDNNFPGTCVSPEGRFIHGVHRPCFNIANLRQKDFIEALGRLPDNTEIFNSVNFPATDVKEENGDVIYEIPNPFPFRGVTYINSRWADKNKILPENIKIKRREAFSFKSSVEKWLKKSKLSPGNIKELFGVLPRPILIAVAESSTDPSELTALAEMVCTFLYDNGASNPKGILFKKRDNGETIPDINDHMLYEIIANNQHLPDDYKNAMVLVPGIQGTSEIVGDFHDNAENSHVFEYLRRNSYIPWGHFAANMANNSIRYNIKDLLLKDMEGLRRLYYQRTYLRLAEQLGIENRQSSQGRKAALSDSKLEELRLRIIEKLSRNPEKLKFNRSLWGWNYGFGYSHSDYNLHASHQQIHQQYAMIPKYAVNGDDKSCINQIPSYSSGDLVEKFVDEYRHKTGKGFFENYLAAINHNSRIDKDPSMESSLTVFEDGNVILFVPKAQTSQFELQLMPKKKCGNVLEADIEMRRSLDRAILISIKSLDSLGARMVTSIEISKRFDLHHGHDQNMIYFFLPKLPMAPGALSEAHLRWINGHYPEDFAHAAGSAAGNLIL